MKKFLSIIITLTLALNATTCALAEELTQNDVQNTEIQENVFSENEMGDVSEYYSDEINEKEIIENPSGTDDANANSESSSTSSEEIATEDNFVETTPTDSEEILIEDNTQSNEDEETTDETPEQDKEATTDEKSEETENDNLKDTEISDEDETAKNESSKKDKENNEKNREERLKEKEEKLKTIKELREMKALVKASKIESLTYLRELRTQFKNIDKEDRKEVLEELAAIKSELQDYSIDTFVHGLAIDYEKYDNVLPVIENGRTLAPVRAVTEALGAEVLWNGETQSIIITKDEIIIELTIGSSVAMVNGEEITLDVAPEIRNERTLVPMRFIAESFDLNVEWDENSLSVIIE